MAHRFLPILLAAALAFPGSVAALENPEAAALAYIANATKSDPTDWVVVAATYADVGTRSNAIWAGKFINQETGDHRAVFVREGKVFDEGDLNMIRNESLSELPALSRKGDASVRKFASEASADASASLGIFLNVDTSAAVARVRANHSELVWRGDRAETTDADLAAQIENELYRAKREAFVAAEASFAAKAKGLGAAIGYASTSAPLIFVDAKRHNLEALANMPEVADLGIEGHWQPPSLAYAGPTVQANWTSTTADQGTGTRVGIVEYDNVRNTGDLAGRVVASHSTTGTLHYTGTGVFDHPTWAAGAVASQDSVSTGIAPGAYIVSSGTGGYVANAKDSAVIQAADWALDPNGGNVPMVSLSLVQDTTSGSETARKYFDSVQWENNDLVVAAAGNLGGQCPIGDSGDHTAVGSPGTGYNVLTVGGIDDKNTTSWSDDVLWFKSDLSEGSCWEDLDTASWNPHHDFNKPNVSAPAKGDVTANGISASGTSVATPIVAGIAAQLQARNAAYLESWPEAIRAMIMAGAIHKTPKDTGALSPAREGVGTVSAKWANNAFADGGGSLGGVVRITETSATDYVRTFTVSANQTVSVAVVWDSHTTSSGATDVLTADYDLTVTKPDGSQGGSYSWDNSYEYYTFEASQSGTVTVKIHPARFDSSTEYLSLAWVKVTTP